MKLISWIWFTFLAPVMRFIAGFIFWLVSLPDYIKWKCGKL